MAGAWAEAQLQLTEAGVPEQRGTIVLLLGMTAWVGVAFAGAVAAAAIVVAGSMLGHWFLGVAAAPASSTLVPVLVATTVFQGILLLAALRQGQREGFGDRRAGLGVRPIRHIGQVALLCTTMVIWLLAFVLLVGALPALREFAKSVTPNVLAGLGEGGPVMALVRVALLVVLAPVAEELFFRGWLWEALLDRGHAALTTAVLTVIPWLLLHGIDAPGRILFLLPAALVFSLARHQGGGVLASLAVHVTNNATAVLMQAIAVTVEQR